MIKRTTLLAVLALMTLASACTGFKKPTIELEGISLGSVGLSGGTLLVNLRVENPNRLGFRADDLRYELFLRAPNSDGGSPQWERLAEGVYDEEIVIGARETRTVQVPVEFRLSQLGPAASSVMRSGRVDYRATGTVRVRAAGSSRTVPFSKTGNVLLGR
ncbi:MAG TPA: LEA type 2 family protein [Longimicrobium sp.]|nr:LEA type 2 family protein [Longimicrobium sp.]